jgi:hypothetical protein
VRVRFFFLAVEEEGFLHGALEMAGRLEDCCKFLLTVSVAEGHVTFRPLPPKLYESTKHSIDIIRGHVDDRLNVWCPTPLARAHVDTSNTMEGHLPNACTAVSDEERSVPLEYRELLGWNVGCPEKEIAAVGI